MSNHRHIATTPTRGLRPVSAPGRRDHGVLVSVLASQLGSEHAQLFAEPVPNPDGATIDWYTSLEGPVHRLDELNPETHRHIRDRTASLTADIRLLAQSFEALPDIASRNAAALLQSCLEIPDLSFVRAVGGAPLLLAWAHRHDAAAAPHGVIGHWVAPLPPAAPPAASSAVQLASISYLPARAGHKGRWWLVLSLWAVFFALLLLIAWRLLHSCGVAAPEWMPRWPLSAWTNHCPAPDPPETAAATPLDHAVDRQSYLENEITRLELDLARRQMMCRVQSASVPPPPAARDRCGSVADNDLDRRLRDAGARSGSVQASLSWDGPADLDLSAVCPSGKLIYWDTRRNCGGELDVDMNFKGKRRMQPVENIVWPDGKAPPGDYRVIVRQGASNGLADGTRVPFSVRVRHDGQEETFEGAVVIGTGLGTDVTNFSVGDKPPGAAAEIPPC